MKRIEQKYFEWIYKLMCGSKRQSWRWLLTRLYEMEFTFTIDMDINRAEDGVGLRQRFAREMGNDDILVALTDTPCSILEMMVALAIRCEEHLMDNPTIGDRTADWFWDMIECLGLSYADDTRFNSNHAYHVLQKFLGREYESNGRGGLFVVEDPRRDMRSAEIWYQMMWYLEGLV